MCDSLRLDCHHLLFGDSILSNGTPHWMTPLLAPKSIALVGGSPREGTVGNGTIKSLVLGEYPGEFNIINPRYEEVESFPCFASLADLTQPPDMAILSVAAHRMEKLMIEAIEAGIRSAVIFDPCFYEGDTTPLLLDRLKAIVRDAGIPVCGGNGMGYYNYASRTFACYIPPETTTPGHISGFCHSGSAFGLMAHADPRFRFNLVTSQGQEIGASVAEYMDYALEQPNTRVIALFLETVRDPERFVEVLEKAERLQIPVVATKVGLTKESARHAQTHSGALTGDDSAFDAVCKRYGVIRTDDLDSLLATCQVFAMDKRPGPGGFAAVLDSGGLGTQMMDIAADIGLEFSALEPHTVKRLRDRLPYGLEPVNPLDAAGPAKDGYLSVFVDCVDYIAEDPNTAFIAQEIYATDIRNSGLVEKAKQVPDKHDKPYVVTYSLSTVRNAGIASELEACGIPLINGVKNMLTAVKNSFEYRDFLLEPNEPAPEIEPQRLTRAREVLKGTDGLRESDALNLLRDLGFPTVQCEECESEDRAVELAERIGLPVALKTAADDMHHKSDVDGVLLGLENEAAVRYAYQQLSRLGSRVAVAEMSEKGVEVAFGMVNDPQFGPIIMVGAGGTLVEVVDDKTFALPPFGKRSAERLLESLKIAPLFKGARGIAPVDMGRLAKALCQFSVICDSLGDVVAEMDLNPMIASSTGCTAVDALIVRLYDES